MGCCPRAEEGLPMHGRARAGPSSLPSDPMLRPLLDSTCQYKRCGRLAFQFLGQGSPLEEEWQPPPAFLPGKTHRQRSLRATAPCESHKGTDTLHPHELARLFFLTRVCSARYTASLKILITVTGKAESGRTPVYVELKLERDSTFSAGAFLC